MRLPDEYSAGLMGEWRGVQFSSSRDAFSIPEQDWKAATGRDRLPLLNRIYRLITAI
jgi:hypothetical protein